MDLSKEPNNLFFFQAENFFIGKDISPERLEGLITIEIDIVDKKAERTDNIYHSATYRTCTREDFLAVDYADYYDAKLNNDYPAKAFACVDFDKE